MSVRVLIVDDHRLFADAIRAALEGLGMVVLGVATTGNQALEEARAGRPDVVLMDLGLPDSSGVSVGRRIMDELPGSKVVAVTAYNDPRTVQEVARSGFHGFVPKSANTARLASSIHSVMNGGSALPRRLPRWSQAVGPSRGRPGRLPQDGLTPREREVLSLLAQGESTPAIARRLSVAPNTVRSHVQNILDKLQVRSRLQAVAVAVRYGLIQNGTAAVDADDAGAKATA